MEQTVITVTQKLDKEPLKLDKVKEMLEYYNEITSKTGEQLGWSYENVAFPYTIEQVSTVDGEDILHLKTKDETLFSHLLVSVSQEETESERKSYIIIHLPSDGTYGDKGKANEFAKFFGKKYKGEVTLFNGRIMTAFS